MGESVKYTVDGGVAVVTIDNPPVNALSPGVPEGIRAAVQRAGGDAEVGAIVIIGAGQTFIAGADIREFGKIVSGEKPREATTLHPLLGAIEDSPKPVIMAIHGTAFGGGLEIAQAGHYRVAVESAQVGQPEVKLGIIPGAAGTQRLPRLAGVAKAAEMCAFGDPISARAALEAGIIDRIVDGDLLAGAIAFAREVAGMPAPKTSERNGRLGEPCDFDALRAAAQRRLRGQEAPLAAIEAVKAATELPFAEGVRREAELFQKCLFSPQSKAMIHAFFGERTVQKIPGIGKEVELLPIRKAAIAGAGTMGGGIAMVFANAGIPVLVREASQEALDRGLAAIRRNYANSVAKGRLQQGAMDRAMSLITPSLSWDGFGEADIIVEAVFENMALKKEIFATLDRVARADAILATNTSTLDIDEIASATSRPEQVIGNHFFSPANVMRLLEVVRGRATSNRVIATCMALGKRLRKVAVLAGNCYGFIGNRMFAPYIREAALLAEDGTPFEAVDQALYEFGMAMGPLAVCDLAGLDVNYRIRQEYRHLEEPGVRYPEVETILAGRGHFGQKTGRGWYLYEGNRALEPNPEMKRIIADYAAEKKLPQKETPAEEIVERTIYALVNEGARLLEEGFAIRPVDIDVVYLNGYGFPVWRGGPMHYADAVGLGRVAAKVEELYHRLGHHWRPAPLLEQLAASGSTFGRWSEERRV
jgi:3-hydroxyacyl-CoA dehydrogenase